MVPSCCPSHIIVEIQILNVILSRAINYIFQQPSSAERGEESPGFNYQPLLITGVIRAQRPAVFAGFALLRMTLRQGRGTLKD